jgi:hypothetical protein
MNRLSLVLLTSVIALAQGKVEFSLSPEAVVQRQVDAYNAHDVAVFTSCYAVTANTVDFATNAVIDKSRQEIEKGFAELFKQYPKIKCTIRSRIVSGSYVIDKEFVEGLDGRSLFGTVIYLVTDGKISRVWFLPPAASE